MGDQPMIASLQTEVAAPGPSHDRTAQASQPVFPGGILFEGRCHKRLRVRELNGADEERLTSHRYASGAEQVTDFLVHVIEEIENLAAPIDPDLVSRMLIGDRDYLLLWLRQTTIGDRVDQVMRCPNPGSRARSPLRFHNLRSP